MKTSETAISILGDIFKSGRTAAAYTEHYTPGFDEPTRTTRKPAVGSGVLDLRALTVMPAASATAHSITLTKSPIVARQAATSISLAAAVIENCLVARAGASVIVAAERDVANANPLPVLYRDAGLYRIVEPAPFAVVVDGEDAAISPAPWADALIQWGDAPNVAFRTRFTRAEQKSIGGGDLLEENVLQAILAGLAEAADRTLLAAIVAAAPSAFTLAAAAARGLRFGNLAALVGNTGQGAAVGSDGTLRAAGVVAELTRTVSETVIGDFHKAAVAVYPEISVHIERFNANGEIGCVVFSNMLPLIPDASAFWLGA